MSDQSAARSADSLAGRIDREKSQPLAWKTVVKRAAVVLVAGVALYFVFPAITEVLASWPRLSTLDPRWIAVAVGAETAHFVCTFALQRLALRLANWALRKRPPLEGLDTILLSQRDDIRAVLGGQWWQALLLSAGRLAFDYLCLLAALRATGSHPRPSLILVAYAVAGIVGLIPHHPRRSRDRGSEPDRAPGARRSQLQPGRTGDAGLPHRLLLGAAVRWTDRLRTIPATVPKPPISPARGGSPLALRHAPRGSPTSRDTTGQRAAGAERPGCARSMSGAFQAGRLLTVPAAMARTSCAWSRSF